MRDFENTELQIGDEVVYTYQPYSSARIRLVRATVVGSTPKKVRVSFIPYPNAGPMVKSVYGDKLAKL